MISTLELESVPHLLYFYIRNLISALLTRNLSQNLVSFLYSPCMWRLFCSMIVCKVCILYRCCHTMDPISNNKIFNTSTPQTISCLPNFNFLSSQIRRSNKRKFTRIQFDGMFWFIDFYFGWYLQLFSSFYLKNFDMIVQLWGFRSKSSTVYLLSTKFVQFSWKSLSTNYLISNKSLVI